MTTQLYRSKKLSRKSIELMCDERTAISPLAKSARLSDDQRKRLVKEYCRARDSYFASLRDPLPDNFDMEIAFILGIAGQGGE